MSRISTKKRPLPFSDPKSDADKALLLKQAKMDYLPRDGWDTGPLKDEWHVNRLGFVATRERETHIVLIVERSKGRHKLREEIGRIKDWISLEQSKGRSMKYELVQLKEFAPETFTKKVANIAPIFVIGGVIMTTLGVLYGPGIILHLFPRPYLPGSLSGVTTTSQNQSQTPNATMPRSLVPQPPPASGRGTLPSRMAVRPHANMEQEPKFSVGGARSPLIASGSIGEANSVTPGPAQTLEQDLNTYLVQQLAPEIGKGEIRDPHLVINAITPEAFSNGTAQCTIDGGISSDGGETLPSQLFLVQNSAQGNTDADVVQNACHLVVDSMIQMLRGE